MHFFTGYFARHANVPHALSIARWEPKGAQHLARLQELAPSAILLHGFRKRKISEKEYSKRYVEGLDALGIAAVEGFLRDGMTLLCWEGPGKFCHRHLLAEWLRGHGHTVKERS